MVRNKWIILFFIIISHHCVSQDFVDGYYINLKNDTINCKIKTYSKRKLQKQDYSFITIMTDSVSERKLMSNEINGYCKGAERFKSFHLKQYNLYFFAKLIVEGEVSLWEKIETLDNTPQLYILKKKSDEDFVVMNISEDEIKVSEGIITIVKTTKKELYWNAVLYLYFKDCDEITSKITTGYYTSSDVQRIVKTYNIWKMNSNE